MKNKKQLKENEIKLSNPQKANKRVGSAKKEMEGFDISLEELNSIKTEDFGL